MGLPGTVNERDEVRNCVNLGWQGVINIRETVRKLLPEAAVLKFGNDASVAALGELWMGAGKKYDSAYLITLGTGVGGGYVRKGSIICGANGAAGEIGHFILNIRETTPCSCGRCGCLEQYASARGTLRLAKNLLELKRGIRTENSLHIESLFEIDVSEIPDNLALTESMEKVTVRDICDLAREGDAFCGLVIDIFGRCMGMALSYISCTADPGVFIIGGGMSGAGAVILDSIRRGYRRYAYPPCADTGIIGALLGGEAGIYGCAAMLFGYGPEYDI